MVNFFNSRHCGFLLCMGGTRVEDELTGIGAPGGPSFHFFGKRVLSALPSPTVGQTMSVHYWEEADAQGATERHLRLVVGDFITNPLRPDAKSATKLPAGPWRPCVLLCVPGTRVRVEHLL